MRVSVPTLTKLTGFFIGVCLVVVRRSYDDRTISTEQEVPGHDIINGKLVISLQEYTKHKEKYKKQKVYIDINSDFEYSGKEIRPNKVAKQKNGKVDGNVRVASRHTNKVEEVDEEPPGKKTADASMEQNHNKNEVAGAEVQGTGGRSGSEEADRMALGMQQDDKVNASNVYQDRYCNQCFSRPYKYLLNPARLCSNQAGNGSLDMVFLVPIKPDATLLRDTLRQTWLSVTHENKSPRVRHVFLLGLPAAAAVRHTLAWEQDIHGDLLQQDFQDSYYNLTIKTMMGLDWATTYCSNARVVVKIDADVFVNSPKLISTVAQMSLTNNMRGLCQKWARPMRYSKWRISEKEYDQNVYPPFCHGPHYIVPMHIAKEIVRVSPDTPPLKLEDVYLGTCLHKTKYGVWSFGALNSGFNLNKAVSEGEGALDCDRVHKMLVHHGTKPETIRTVWDTCLGKNDTVKPP